MLTFFRKIRKSLVDSSSARKYLLYGIGEILLVMIGILLAMQVNNWNEARKSAVFERELLVDLRNTLVEDFSLINMTLKGNEKAIRSSEIILSHFEEDIPYADSLAKHFESVFIWWKMLLKTSAYQKAKSYGLDFIHADSTRIMLSDVYETNLSFAETLDERQSLYYYTTVTPILTELFQSIDKTWHLNPSGNVPNNYEELKNDLRYRNILKTNIGNRNHFNSWVRMTIRHMEALERMLQLEIDRK